MLPLACSKFWIAARNHVTLAGNVGASRKLAPTPFLVDTFLESVWLVHRICSEVIVVYMSQRNGRDVYSTTVALIF